MIMKDRKVFFGCVFLFALAMSCKKDKDTSAPYITFSAPQAGSTYYYDDFLSVAAHVSDDKQLQSIKVSVTNAGGQEFLQSINYVDAGTEKHISTSLYHNDLYLASGTYYVTITANDGENEMKAFREIQLVEAPAVLEKFFIMSQYSSDLAQMDTYIDNTFSQINYFNAQYGKGMVNSRQHFFAYGNNTSGTLLIYDALDYSLISFVQTNGISSSDYFNCAVSDESNGDIYYGADINQIWRVGANASINAAIVLPDNFFAHHLAISDDFVFASTRNIQNTQQTISVFNKSTGALFQSLAIDVAYDLKGITLIDDNRILLIGNQNGESLFKYYNNETNALNNVFTFYNTSECTGVWPGAEGYFFVAHNEGIVKYNTDAEMLSTGLELTPLKMVYEKVSGQVFAVTADGVHLLNSSATSESDFIATTNCRDVLLLYNK